jgi:hypothetical protein
MTLPERVLNGVCRSFIGSPFSSRAVFDSKVRQYQIDICKKDTWRPDQVVIPCPCIRVVYRCWERDEQIEPVIELASENGESFTAGDLLFQLHNAVVEHLREIDHHFLEGLVLHSRQVDGKPPLYVLRQGS